MADYQRSNLNKDTNMTDYQTKPNLDRQDAKIGDLQKPRENMGGLIHQEGNMPYNKDKINQEGGHMGDLQRPINQDNKFDDLQNRDINQQGMGGLQKSNLVKQEGFKKELNESVKDMQGSDNIKKLKEEQDRIHKEHLKEEREADKQMGGDSNSNFMDKAKDKISEAFHTVKEKVMGSDKTKTGADCQGCDTHDKTCTPSMTKTGADCRGCGTHDQTCTPYMTDKTKLADKTYTPTMGAPTTTTAGTMSDKTYHGMKA
jgi:hypothetical protein